jgi:adenylosuccinate lyase
LPLCELPLPQLAEFDKERYNDLRDIYLDFDPAAAELIKETERTTNHDVKAVEYYIKQRFTDLGLQPFKEFVHFGLTSQDINNTAIPLLLKEGLDAEFLPAIGDIIVNLTEMATEWDEIPMLARTHGQPASPTLLGKRNHGFC